MASRMIRSTAFAASLVATLMSAGPSESQISPDVWRAYEEKIKPAVYCIRTTARYERPAYSTIDGSLSSGYVEETWHGSGVALPGTVDRNGRTEYRILTNNHVVKAEPFKSGSRLVKVAYALVDNSDDKNPADDVAAVLDIQNPDKDQAILVTVNAPRLAVAQITQLGASSELRQGDRLLTTGFPNAVTKTSVDGTLSANDYDDAQVLPYPGKVYSANIPIDPGQSGSPVVRPIARDGEHDFELVGLIYAKNPFSDQIRLITPIEKDSATLAAKENLPSRRPSLTAPVGPGALDRLSADRAGITALYGIGGYKSVVRKQEDGTYLVRHFREQEGVILQNETLDFRIAQLPHGGVAVLRIVDTKDGVTTEHAVRAERQDRLNGYVNALVNHFIVQRELGDRASLTTANSDQTRFTDYYRNLVGAQADDLRLDAWLVYSQLYNDGVISQQFR